MLQQTASHQRPCRLFSLSRIATLPSVIPPLSASDCCLRKMDALIVSSEQHASTFWIQFSILCSEQWNTPQHLLRLPASLRSVRSLWGTMPCLQIQRSNAASQSHKSRLHGGLEAFRTTFCPICLKTPERQRNMGNTLFKLHLDLVMRTIYRWRKSESQSALCCFCKVVMHAQSSRISGKTFHHSSKCLVFLPLKTLHFSNVM